MKLLINQTVVEPDCPPGTVLLDLLRGYGLKGVKEGCREGDCGACTVLIGELSDEDVSYKTAASCLLPVGDCYGKHIVSIEGLNGEDLSPVQQTIADEGATQCGFCTPGIVVALTGFLLTTRTFSIEDALAAVEGNICRCTGYMSIKRACENLVSKIAIQNDKANRIQTLVEAGQLPAYFLDVRDRLKTIQPAQVEIPLKDAVKVAGGTDLFVQKPDTLLNQPLDFLSAKKDLQKILKDKNCLIIGGAVTVEMLKTDPLIKKYFPEMQKALDLVSSTLIRNRATIAGNIVNASPIGDITIMLLALGATLVLKSADQERTIALDAFYQGYKKFDLREDEIIRDVKIPLPSSGSRFNFEKVSRREHLDIASVNTAICLVESEGVISHARISAGGVAPIPFLLNQASEFLKGKSVSVGIVRQCIQIMENEISPIDDVRGSARYKRNLLRRLLAAHFITFYPQLEEDLARDFS